MRVLLVNDWDVPRGGAEVLTAALRDELRGRRHDVRVFASSTGAGFADWSCRTRDPASHLQTATRVVNPAAALGLRRALTDFRPDVVHVRMFLSQLSPLILPLLRSVPAVYHAVIHEMACPTLNKQLPDGSDCAVPAGRACRRNGCLSAAAWPALMLQRRLVHRWRDAFEVVIANSEATARLLEADGAGPVRVIPNGVPERAMRDRLTEHPTVGYAGRLTAPKGVDVLLRAFAEIADALPMARMVVLGDGDERGALQRLGDELGVAGRVEWLGHRPREEVERILSGVWAQVVPSRYREPFGLVAAEAMMRGTAVVASDTGGLAEVVEHRSGGLLVRPGDHHDLAAALRGLLGDRARLDRMAAAGRERARTLYAMDTFADRILVAYRQAIDALPYSRR